MYNLIKVSDPGWEFKSENIDHIYGLLDRCVCNECKMTKKEMKESLASDLEYQDYLQSLEEVDRELVEDFNFMYVFPENYETLHTKDKIGYLLSSPCGAEFILEEI